jgi:hypothetical protein
MRKKLAYASVVIGFILIVLNAVEYIGGFFWGLSLQIGTSMVVGIALFMVGMFLTNKKNS